MFATTRPLIVPMLAALAVLGGSAEAKYTHSPDIRLTPEHGLLAETIIQPEDDARRIAKNLERWLEEAEVVDPNRLLLLAEAEHRVAYDAYRKALEAFEARRRCYQEGRCAKRPEAPKPDYRSAREYYHTLIRRFPKWPRLKLVRYRLGCVTSAPGPAHDGKLSALLLQGLLKDSDKLPIVRQTRLTLGDLYFSDKRYRKAVVHYEAVVTAHPGDRTAAYAAYRLAWSHRYAGRKDQAVRALQLARGIAIRAHVRDVILQTERDLVHLWSKDKSGLQAARYFFLGEYGADQGRRRLAEAAAHLRGRSDKRGAVAVYRMLLADDPVDARRKQYRDALAAIRKMR